MTDSYEVRAFDAERGGESASLATLHAALLPHSPAALLGPSFLEDFYYSKLPARGLIFGAVAYVDSAPAGFIVATDDSAGFMGEGIRRDWPTLALIGAKSVFSPKRLGAIFEAIQIMRHLDAPAGDRAVGELLSFGVLPQYRSREFMRTRNLRIGLDLQRAAIEQLRARGAATVRAIVDSDNVEARLFYRGAGWTPGADKVPGWRKETVEYLLRLGAEDSQELT